MTKFKKVILSLPNSGSDKFIKLTTKYSQQRIDVNEFAASNIYSNDSSVPSVESIGLYICEPSSRLASAYHNARKNSAFKQTFEEFYSDAKRIEESSVFTGKVDINNVSFIGCEDLALKSLLLSQAWLKNQLSKIPHGELFKTVPARAVSDKDQEKIRRLYAKEYDLYTKCLTIFGSHWKEYQAKNKISVAPNKTVVIHLGPPKTGTSAIQAWLSRNSEQLLEKKIYYPSHGADKNGVSSGNFSDLISFDNEHRGYFDYNKTKLLIDEFNSSSYETLLLSSEHFYYYLLWLFTFLDDAKFIFYIRHPIAVLESGYHQGVKRHLKTEKFSTPTSISFSNLNVISRITTEINANVEYRFFDEKLFDGESLHSDFSACFSNFISAPVNEKRLNTQYSAGALTLMRMVNGFGDNFLRTELDFWLQRDSESQPNFSLIPPDKIGNLQIKLMHEATKLKQCTPNMNGTKLDALLEQYKHVNYYSNDECIKDFNRVLCKLRHSSPLLVSSILSQCCSANDIETFELLRKGFGVKGSSLKYISIANWYLKCRYGLNKLISRYFQ
ncbi:hypothetical protein Q4561_19570 [Alteromonas sp. 1_MG-2023]|uniref:hypothetical protein n=1 Tax=Alteromonas sp. 1_MG-2023 TaxID=3062669 RepID=UPI0026E4325D|nr:hypothetical protein [Alteromonas sp. 1_MG-2023]MDO6569270.1 hypothetical protein [Alteromonas sp. 1_MG-2023]